MAVKEDVNLPTQRICVRCHFVSSQEVCKACVLLEGLNKGLPKLGIGKTSKAKKMLEEYQLRQAQNKIGDIEDFDDNNIADRNGSSKNKPCRSGLCKTKHKDNSKDSDTTKNSNCGKKNCCSQKVSQCDKENISNAKINSLLEQYGINEQKSNGNQSSSNELDNEIDTETLIAEEEDSCAGGCGRTGSMQIGF
jgi:hypothetical protein